VSWTIGVEIELLAPRGASRRTLAEVYGTPRAFFHPQSELSAVPDTPVFENLTLGFEVPGVASCVDGQRRVSVFDQRADRWSGQRGLHLSSIATEHFERIATG